MILGRPVLVSLATAVLAVGPHPQSVITAPSPIQVFSPSDTTSARAESVGSLHAQADRLLEKADRQLMDGEITASIKSVDAARLIYRKLGDRRREAAALIDIGIRYASNKESARGISFINEALKNARELGDREVEDLGLKALAAAELVSNPLYFKAQELLRTGDEQYEKRSTFDAIMTWQQALGLFQELGDKNNALSAIGKIAQAYDELSAYQESLAHYERYVLLARELSDRRHEGLALGNMSFLYSHLGEKDKALALLRQCLAIAREVRDPESEAGSLLNLGLYFYAYEEFQRAIGYYQESLNIAKRIKHDVLEVRSTANLGVTYLSIGDYRKANDMFQRVMAISVRSKDSSGVLLALGNLGLLHAAQGNLGAALDDYQRALTIARRLKHDDHESQALNNIGSILVEAGRPAEAESALRASLKWRESETQQHSVASRDADKIAVFEQGRTTFGILQKSLVAQGKINDALEIAERGRARVFIDLMARRLAPTTASRAITPPSISAIQEIASAEEATIIEYSIVNRYEKVDGRRQEIESEVFIWVIKPTGEVFFRRAELGGLLQSRRMTLSEFVSLARWSILSNEGPPQFVNEGARPVSSLGSSQPDPSAPGFAPMQQLHRLLIAPIADLLPTDAEARIVFVPEGPLFLIPFAALEDEQGNYLVQRHTITIAPSIQTLQLTHALRREARPVPRDNAEEGKILVIGNPTMPRVQSAPGVMSQQLSSLPASGEEADAIANLFGTTAITKDRATKAAVVQGLRTAKIVHLATHGLLDDVRGTGSAIALAPSDGDDGLLTADELLGLTIRSKMVVLSACNTGRGRITGDGVIGLSRSLISGGVASVVSSLWFVPDSPTAALMTAFYRNLQSNSDIAASLRRAMLSTMVSYPRPKDWAAFVLIGEAKYGPERE